MVAHTSEIDHLLKLFAPFAPLSARCMFGSRGIYADGATRFADGNPSIGLC